MNHRLSARLAAAASIVALAASACGPAPVSDAERELANIEGRWMCDVQRFAFQDLADLDSELEHRLVGNGHTVVEYQAFKERVTDVPELRTLVRQSFDGYCA